MAHESILGPAVLERLRGMQGTTFIPILVLRAVESLLGSIRRSARGL